MKQITEVINNFWHWYKGRKPSKRLATSSILGGLLLIICGLGLRAVIPASAQSPPAVPPPNITGNCNNFGNNNFNCNNIVVPMRLVFSDQLGRQLLDLMPDKTKPVTMTVVGGSSAQTTGDDFYKFLKDNGYGNVDRGSRNIGMYIPPEGAPDNLIYVVNEPNSYHLVINPNAH